MFSSPAIGRGFLFALDLIMFVAQYLYYWGGPVSRGRSGLWRVCPHLCWDEVFISGFCVI